MGSSCVLARRIASSVPAGTRLLFPRNGHLSLPSDSVTRGHRVGSHSWLAAALLERREADAACLAHSDTPDSLALGAASLPCTGLASSWGATLPSRLGHWPATDPCTPCLLTVSPALSDPFSLLWARGFSKRPNEKKGGKGTGKGEAKDRSKDKDVALGKNAAEDAADFAEEAKTDVDAEEGEHHRRVSDIWNVPDSKTVLLSRDEVKGALVEGLPVGIERDLHPHLGGAPEAYPVVMRRPLRDLLQSLSSHAAAVTGGAPTFPVKDLEVPAGAPGEVPDLAATAHRGRTALLLRGPPGSGKSVILGLAVAWARAHGWLVLYVPRARDWARGGLYYPHPGSLLWDTPVQAQQVLQHLLAAHGSALGGLPARSRQPLALSEAPGADRPPRGSGQGPRLRELASAAESPSLSLRELAGLGAEEREVAVSALLRVREELAHVQGIPVLIAVDEYNAWFTFSSYFESTGDRSRRQIHANELRLVNAFRPMEGTQSPVVMVGAFSESIAVGRLAPKLPGIPQMSSFHVPRFTVDESKQILLNNLYMTAGISAEEVDEDMLVRVHHLSVGNGVELKRLSPLLR